MSKLDEDERALARKLAMEYELGDLIELEEIMTRGMRQARNEALELAAKHMSLRGGNLKRTKRIDCDRAARLIRTLKSVT